MQKLKEAVNKVIEWICVALVAVMTILVTWQVVTRYVFNNPSAISEQLAKYLFVWLVMIGAAYVFGKKDHMAVEFIKDLFSVKVKLILEIISEIIIAGFAIAVLIFGGYKSTLMTMTQIDASLGIPVAYLYSVIVLSGVLIVFYAITNIGQVIKQFAKTR